MGFIAKHWRGEYSLPRSYWVHTFLTSLVAPAVAVVLAQVVAERPARYSSAALLFVAALGYLAWFWAVRGTWLAATKHRRAGGGWGWLAKTAIILGAFRWTFELVAMSGGYLEHGAIVLGKQAGPTYTLHISDDGESIRIRGGMNDGAAASLDREVRQTPSIRTVTLDSTGGWTREGALVASVIKRYGLSTRVDGQCSSACTVAFLAGQQRTLGPGAKLGFHQVRTVGNAGYLRAVDVVKTRVMYEPARLPRDFIDKVAATPPEQMWYPTFAELRRANVVTEVTEWNGARETLAEPLREQLKKGFGEMRLPAHAFEKLLDCELTARIKWLNQTDCAFLFDATTKSREVHLAEQDACLQKAGLLAESQKIDLACSKAHVPNDWAIFSNVYTAMFTKSLAAAGVDPESATVLGRCVATGYVEELGRTWCTPLNPHASNEQELFDSACVERHRASLDQRVEGMVQDCKMRVARLKAPAPRVKYASLSR